MKFHKESQYRHTDFVVFILTNYAGRTSKAHMMCCLLFHFLACFAPTVFKTLMHTYPLILFTSCQYTRNIIIHLFTLV